MRKPNLSKSRYTKGMQCPKMLWMDLHMPDQFDSSVTNEAILVTGSLVGDVAMGYYGARLDTYYPSSYLGQSQGNLANIGQTIGYGAQPVAGIGGQFGA